MRLHLALGALHNHGVALHFKLHSLRERNRFLSDTRHFSNPFLWRVPRNSCAFEFHNLLALGYWPLAFSLSFQAFNVFFVSGKIFGLPFNLPAAVSAVERTASLN
jgi:hypothetical protein